MPAVKTYTRVNFQNYPSTSTPLNATNLNKMDKGIDDLDDEVVTVKNAIENMSFDADSISYDNTQSGLQSTDVQGAVDEINDNLTASNQTAGVTDVPFRFGCTDDGKFGYIINQGGADSVIPFRSMLNKACFVASGWTGAAQDAFLFADDGSVTSMKLGQASLEDNNLKVEMINTGYDYLSRVYVKTLGTKVKVIKYSEADSTLTINDVTTTSANQLVLELNGRSSAPYNFGTGFVQLY